MLVQVLAGTEAEREPAGQHRADGRRGLSDDRRMRSDQRAGDAGGELESLRRLRDPAEHTPDERALALGVDPGVEVVGDHREGEAQLLRPRGVANEVERCVLLGREPIAELRHGALVPRVSIAETPGTHADCDPAAAIGSDWNWLETGTFRELVAVQHVREGVERWLN